MSLSFSQSAVRERESSCHQKLCHSPPLLTAQAGLLVTQLWPPRSSLSLQLTMTAWSVVISSRDDDIILFSHHPLATRSELCCPIGCQLSQSGFCLYLIQLQGFSQNCKPLQTLSQYYITKLMILLMIYFKAETELFTMLHRLCCVDSNLWPLARWPIALFEIPDYFLGPLYAHLPTTV